MPIYEFRCLKCNEIVELLFRSADEAREIKCTHCGCEELEKVMSRSNYSVASSSNSAPRASASTRQCSTGSCSTLEIPGLDS